MLHYLRKLHVPLNRQWKKLHVILKIAVINSSSAAPSPSTLTESIMGL